MDALENEINKSLSNRFLGVWFRQNSMLGARVANVVDSKATDQRPACYDLIKFAVQKEAEINFDDAKKTRNSTSKLKVTTHFYLNHKKSGLSATPAVWMVALAPEEGSGEGEATPPPSEESDGASLMKLCKKIQPSPKVTGRLLSGWSRHLRHLPVDASDVTKWDIDSMMRNVKCTIWNF